MRPFQDRALAAVTGANTPAEHKTEHKPQPTMPKTTWPTAIQANQATAKSAIGACDWQSDDYLAKPTNEIEVGMAQTR